VWNVKTSDSSNMGNWNHLQINSATDRKSNKRPTENDYIGHCTHTHMHTYVRTYKVIYCQQAWWSTLRIREQLQCHSPH
jgi:hypothetical protein